MADNLGLSDPKDKLVFVVDDDASVLELMEFVIKKEGFRFEKAADGQEALDKIHALKPDIVLLDLMLPRYGGFEILRQLQEGETAKIPIIVITGRYTDRSTSEMIRRESNVADFFEKPVRPALLSAALHKMLKTSPPELKKT